MLKESELRDCMRGRDCKRKGNAPLRDLVVALYSHARPEEEILMLVKILIRMVEGGLRVCRGCCSCCRWPVKVQQLTGGVRAGLISAAHLLWQPT